MLPPKNNSDSASTRYLAGIVPSESKLKKSLNESWDLVRELPNNKFLLKRSFAERILTQPRLEEN